MRTRTKAVSRSILIAMTTIFGSATPSMAAKMEQWLPARMSEGLVTAPRMTPTMKVGYLNRDGKLMIANQFDSARPFAEGLAAVRKNDRWGYINHDGQFVIQPKFEHLAVLDYPGDDPIDFSEGFAVVKQGGFVGFIDKTGKFVIKPRFLAAWQFQGGTAAAQDAISGKWGFIDRQGKYVIQPKFFEAFSFSEGLAAVSNKNRGEGPGWGYIDKSGDFVITPQYDLALSFKEGLGLALKMKNGCYEGRFIDKAGKELSELNCHGGYPFSEGLAPVPLEKFKFGFIDKTGKTAIKAQFQDARSFSEQVAVVKVDKDKWGMIDKDGNLFFSTSVK